MQYATIEREYVVTTEVCKSKFICRLAPIETLDEGLEYVARIKKEFSDARHNCYAIVGTPESNALKYSDDGEPSGTAGIPMMGALQKNGLYGVACVVTRYFGGIKLGAGGLVRAYAGAGSDVIKLCQLGTFNDLKTIRISCDIPYAKKLLDYLRNNNVKVISQEYSNLFSVKVAVEDENILCGLSDEYIKEQLETTKVFYDKDNEN